MANGYTTLNIAAANLADEVLVNRGGKTSRQAISLLAMQVWSMVGGPARQTQAELFADLDWDEGTLGTVWGDEDEARLGIYRKLDIAEAGTWERIGDLPVGTASTARIADAVNLEASERRDADLAITAALLAAGSVFATVEAGMAAVADGATFIVAAPDGEGILIYRRDGFDATELSTLRPGAALARQWALASQLGANQAALFDGYRIDSLDAFALDTAVTYAPDQPGTVVAGNPFYDSESGLSYEALDAAAENYVAINLNGVKLRLRNVVIANGAVFASIADLKAARILAPVMFVSVGRAMFRRDVGGHLTTADGAKWSAEGHLTPLHFGAEPFNMAVDQSAIFNEMSDWVRTQYNYNASSFLYTIDLLGLAWRCDSWNLTNIRQPAFTFGNGTIVSMGTERTVVDCAGTNHGRILGELSIEAPDRNAAPRVGMCIGRAEFGGAVAPIAPDWAGNVRVDGYYSKAAFVNIASEVSRMRLHLTNRSRRLTAFCLAHVGHMGTLDEFVGGLTSEYVTLPTAAAGLMSNILHDYGQLICKRGSDVSMPILGISQTVPAVVSVSPSTLATSEWVVGTTLYFHDHDGMPELKHRVVKIAAINFETGAIELAEGTGEPLNASSYAPWTGGGRVWTATGPAMLFGSVRGLSTRNAYGLTYGRPICIVDCSRGGNGHITLDFQQEASPSTPVQLYTGNSNNLVQGLTINILNANQTPGDVFLRVTGTGTLRIDNFELSINGAYSTPPSGGIIGGIGMLTLRNAKITVPLAADVQWSGYTSFSGKITAMDPYVSREIIYGIGGVSATAAQLQSATSQINTLGKISGMAVTVSDANNRQVYAASAAPTGNWRDGNGNLVYTPV